MSNSYDEIKDTSKNLTGYLRISVKKNEGFEEGYIFLENGRKIGYYYNYGMDEKTGNNAKELIDSMKDSNYVVEMYEYDDSKLKLMKELFKEIFIKDLPKSKPKKIASESTSESSSNSKGYQKIVLNIPEGKPLKLNANKDYKSYLKGIVLLDAFKKDNDNYKRCYIVYDGETPILVAYEDNNGILFGKDANEFIDAILNDQDAVIDIYEYDESKVDILKEYYPKMNLIEETPNDEKYEEEDLDDFVESLLNKQKTVREEEENLSKEELLKKLGIKAPDEDLIDDFVNSVIVPDAEELKNLEEEFREKITKFLEGEPDIQNFVLNLSVEYKDGYICNCNVDIFPKRKLGIIKKEINVDYIVDKISRIIRDNILDVKPELTVNVK